MTQPGWVSVQICGEKEIKSEFSVQMYTETNNQAGVKQVESTERITESGPDHILLSRHTIVESGCFKAAEMKMDV